MASSLLAILKFGWPFRIDTTGAADGSALAEAAMGLSKFRDILTAFDTRLREVRADPNLSDTGRAAAVRKLAEDTLATVRSVEGMSPVVTPRGALTKLEKSVKFTLPPADAAATVREMAILQTIRGDGGHEARMRALTIFDEAVEVGDTETVCAIARAPRLMRPLTDAQMQPGLAVLAELANPDASRELAALRPAVAAVEEALTDTRRIIAEEAGIADDPATRMRAAGQTRQG